MLWVRWGPVLVLSSVLTAHGGDAAAEPHLRIFLGGSWSIGPCHAAQCPCQAGRRCQGAGRQWGAQAGGQYFLCPRACYPKANASEKARHRTGIVIHPTAWVLLAEILSTVAKRRVPTLFSCSFCTEQTHGGVEPACPGTRCCRHRAVTHFATWDSGCGCLTHVSSWQQQLLLLKGFCSCPAWHRVVAKHSWSWSAALCLITSGHKPALKIPASSLGSLEIQQLAWQADTQPTGPVKSAQQ